MKTIIKFFMLLVSAALLFSSCYKKDIDALKKHDKDQDNLIAQLRETINTINTDIKTLQTLTDALQKNISVKSYTATSTGYTLTMSNGSTIELKNGTNGTNGKDGADAPKIGVKKDADDAYYWTLAGDWLLQNGQKLRVTGNNGQNGTNSITPLLKVDGGSNRWMISYDSGATWALVTDAAGNSIPATGPQGVPGQTGSQGPQGSSTGITGFSITEDTDAIVITYMGTSYTLSKGSNNGGSSITGSKIVFATNKIEGSEIRITMNAEYVDRADVWIDLNNNEIRDPGERVDFFDDYKSTYTIGKSKTIAIYGNITFLDINNDSLTNLDVSANPMLTFLNCSFNEIFKLDISKNTALMTLFCHYNHISQLDVTNNTALKNFWCHNNSLSVLDVSKNKELTTLFCFNNYINEANMTALINSLPTTTSISTAQVFNEYTPIGTESNTLPTPTDNNVAKIKNWELYKIIPDPSGEHSSITALLNP